jgi:hypothetical protein
MEELMPLKGRPLLSICGVSILFLTPLSGRAQEVTSTGMERTDAAKSFINVACDPTMPQELRSFKWRQISRRASYVRDTITTLRDDAARHKDTYTPDDQRDLTATIQILQSELDEIGTFETSGCSATPPVRQQTSEVEQPGSLVTHVKREGPSAGYSEKPEDSPQPVALPRDHVFSGSSGARQEVRFRSPNIDANEVATGDAKAGALNSTYNASDLLP